MIENIRAAFACDEIWLIPSGERVDKHMDASVMHRHDLATIMAEDLAQEDGPRISVTSIELDRKEMTRTIDTMRELSEKYPDHEFHFIVSSELIPHIQTWEEGDTLFNTVNYLILERPGYSLEKILCPPLSYKIPHGEIPELSSTHVRTITDKRDLAKLTSERIADYIFNKKIYGFK